MAENANGAVLITGASTGIGKACALLLDHCGYVVFAGVRSEEAAGRLQSEASDRLLPVILDITDQGQIANGVKSVKNVLGPAHGLAGLINNAGIVVSGPLEFLPLDRLRRQFEVNVIGQIAVIQAFLPMIRKGRGRIINIGTAGCHVAPPFLGPYIASKSAMETLTGALRRELAPWGIPVSMVVPGAIETAIWDKSLAEADKIEAEFPVEAKRLYSKRFTAGRKMMLKLRGHAVTPEAVAGIVRAVLKSRRPKRRYLVGTGAFMMTIITRIFPDPLVDWLIGKGLKDR
ncbi:MAG: SDR family oxidoreductase [Thermodesulfobacteriota bacterium]|nr:SDR family oxidoreductase [Thermodesulfobacteriota bacterium]